MSRRIDPLLLFATTTLVLVALIGLVEATNWVGKPFPGFLVLGNRVVASAGLARWPATQGGDLYQHEVVAVDGAPLHSAEELRTRVGSLPPGTPLTYRFRRGEREFERSILTRRFGWIDFAFLFGLYLLNGLVLGGTALTIRYLRGRHPLANATFPVLMLAALWALSAMDLYGPSRLFRLHVLCEVFLFASALQMAFGFPNPARLTQRYPWLPKIPYAMGAGLALVYEIGLGNPTTYVITHLLATSALGTALLVLILSQVWRYLRPPSFHVRRQIRVLALGAVVALTLPVCLTIAEALTGGRAPQNAVAFTAFLFPLSLGYTLRSHKLHAGEVRVPSSFPSSPR